MDRIGLDLDDGGSGSTSTDGNGAAAQNPAEARRLSIQRCIQSLVHACQCRDANCRLASCQKMKRVMAHTRSCRRKTNGGCPVCKQLIALCCYHAKHCQETRCPVPFCVTIKQKLRQLQNQVMAEVERRMVAVMGGMAETMPAAVTFTAQLPQNTVAVAQRMTVAGQAQRPQTSVSGPSNAGSQAALQKLLLTLRSPASPEQQHQVLSILKSSPQLMATFLNQRKQQQQMLAQKQQAVQQIQGQTGAVAINQPQTATVINPSQQQTVQDNTAATGTPAPQIQQQVHGLGANQGLIVLNKTTSSGVGQDQTALVQQLRLQQLIQQQQHATVQHGAGQVRPTSITLPTTTQYAQQQTAQQHGHQQMIIVRHPGAQQPQAAQQQQMLVVTAANNSQQMQLLQQHNNIRLSQPSRATAPSPRQPTPGHFMSPRNPLHTTLSGTVLSQSGNTSSVDQQGGFGLNLDLTGLGNNQLGVRNDGDVTPLTPQDQLSRYVDQL